MKQNIEDLKKKVDSMNYSNENNTNEINGEEISCRVENEKQKLEKGNKEDCSYVWL